MLFQVLSISRLLARKSIRVRANRSIGMKGEGGIERERIEKIDEEEEGERGEA